MAIERVRLGDVPVGHSFAADGHENILEHRGQGWYGVYGQSYNGGPWHMSVDTIVSVERQEPHPSQRLSSYV